MKELNQRVKSAPKSKIRELFDLAAGRSEVISLGIGQPDFDTPEPAISGNIEALRKNITHYAPTRGVPELLQLLEEKVHSVNNIPVDWKENIIMANGGSNAITLAYATLFNSGDELIVNSPNFVSYFYCGSFFGINVKEIKRNEDFSLNMEEIENTISDKTKAILINSPNNPTGYALTNKEWKSIANLVLENDLYLISDEVYENYTYDDVEHVSPASIDGMFERTITLNAMSKMFSATGFRLGYVVANKQIIDLMEKYLQYTVAGTNHAAQYGFIEALKMDRGFFDDILKSFDERRILVYNRLKDLGFEVVKPRGSFYIMPSVKKYSMSGLEFSTRLMQEKAIAIVPGEIFGSYSENMLRISYATAIKKLNESMDRIEDFVNNL
ncbi:MAG: aminotransferase class I/II-fold pyridoxal phosphate-dependent enzyme [Candidatus Lokiarchaeota archaeon]|nr:aminotransferase class I/II-fold pyridoxal phosphate-dependent enzyme [Candidatus Lokiarchaeota archaeon]MBD3338260.1 aminotransferase class I/II-fold pyridoxal phosphate-dependent enzyme [Candidatus Lokiarchaeota archaeon]